jgi:precorrin-2 dehydrogenase/sirohydrochlorin ferrochelatase
MPNLFPMFLRLEGRRCVLVGAGKVAAQKLDALLAGGAHVHIVAPRATENIQQLVRQGDISWSRRTFETRDLSGATLVIAATGNSEINAHVFREARRQGVFCNAVDEPEHCDFYYPAVVRRGDLQIAISTAGHSPALAQRLRCELESQFSETYADWLLFLGGARRRLFQRRIDPLRRKGILHRLVTPRSYERFVRSHTAKEFSR